MKYIKKYEQELNKLDKSKIYLKYINKLVVFEHEQKKRTKLWYCK